MDGLAELVIEVPAPDAPALKEEDGSLLCSLPLSLPQAGAAVGEPLGPSSTFTIDVPAPETQIEPTPEALPALAAATPATALTSGLEGVAAALAGEGEALLPMPRPPGGTSVKKAAAAAVAAAAAAASGPGPASPAAPVATGGGGGGAEDELAASLLSNMAVWQSELDTFQAILRRCMESRPPAATDTANGAAVDESSRGPQRLHSGPKGITGFRGVTQHKRTRRYEANVWMDHKQMYLGAFDVPEQAAHAHDIGALCSGKAKIESLNFPLTDYQAMLPMLHSLPHSQIVSSLRGFGRLPTARPPGGISSGRQYSSAAARTAAARRKKHVDTDSDEDGPYTTKPRARRQRKPAASPANRGAAALTRLPLPGAAFAHALQDPRQQQQQQQQGSWLGGALLPPLPLPSLASFPAAAAAAGTPTETSMLQQAQLQALSAALLGGLQAEATPFPSSGAPAQQAADGTLPPGAAAAHSAPQPSEGSLPQSAGSGSPQPDESLLPQSPFEAELWRVMAAAQTLLRPDECERGPEPRPLHSGPKGQSGFKGVTLYKRCQRYNAHIWLGKQTHIGTFHTAAQAAVAHDVMEVWRNEAAQGLNFALGSYLDLLPLLRQLSEADALAALRNYSRSPGAAAAALAAGITTHMPVPRIRPPTSALQQPSGDTSYRSTAAAAAGSPAPGQQPSLRKRQRKPAHGSASGGGMRSDDSGGSVPPQRQSAGSLMWYMLEQEKESDSESESEVVEADEEDSDFSPEDAADGQEQQVVTKRRRSESPASEPLNFQPQSTPSVAAALAYDIPPDQVIVGARPPRPGSSHRWGLAISQHGQSAWFGRIDRQRAAVAADLALLWRRSMAAAAAEEEQGGPDDKDVGVAFNVPSAGYEEDQDLLHQLRRVKTASQLAQFLSVVVPQDPPAAHGMAAAAAAANAAGAARLQALAATPLTTPSVLLGARKRKQQALWEGARTAQPQPQAGAEADTPQDTAGAGGGDGASGSEPRGAMAEAAAVVAAADTSNSASMLAAVQLLVAAGKGGRLLQEVAAGWDSYALMQQQDLFGALRQPVSSGDWEQLEGRIQVVHDLASLF
ncbi:hypothetical protein D9Q98_001279 [Chlorella vulgaris]|uniref:AP2/ERF domain-containing protein n=1 Tax=Chlorella vulgaris TaxID=3077 RepID=A0A9D4Z2Y4_CHLVU|nr:hypothetical protein D9Q98_001279 [Chlorella vulgaris]